MGTLQIRLLLLLGILIARTSGQDKSFLTWNTQGATWPTVVRFLGQYDVLAIQESGALYPSNAARQFPYRLEIDTTDTVVADVDDNGISNIMGSAEYVQSYKFTVNGNTYYLYYYERRVDNATHQNIHGDQSQQNMAIISNKRAATVYFIPPDSNFDWRTDINRPILGIRLDNYMIFTTHTDPTRGTNEINLSISKVVRYMAAACHHLKWILMGDFNELPGNVQLPVDTRHCFHQKVFPALPTRPASGRIIDFGVYGGPINWRNNLQANTLINVRGSDHLPVAIQPRNANNRG
ncbi:hypothetical protein ACLKA7_004719 [Drosophila subpalustris]